MGGIVVIGWGSLLWDPECLAPHVGSDWHRGQGPELPLEFVRVSPKRKNALTVVIDGDHDARCRTSFVPSRRTDIADAVADLAARERTTADNIGFVDRTRGRMHGRSRQVCDAVWASAEMSAVAGAAWTDLPRNYETVTGRPFTVRHAISYLRSLESDAALEAKRYIELAPAEVSTPLRQALAHEAWWRGVGL